MKTVLKLILTSYPVTSTAKKLMKINFFTNEIYCKFSYQKYLNMQPVKNCEDQLVNVQNVGIRNTKSYVASPSNIKLLNYK